MSKATILDTNFKANGSIDLPQSFENISEQNLYIYVKSYLASLRANSAHSKTKSEVSGGGKKPWAQKGRGGARAGSIRSNVWVGGGVAHGPRNERNYDQKVNKKQKRKALEFALDQKAKLDKLFVTDLVLIESGKTKDANSFIKALNVRDVLIVKDLLDEKTFFAFRNLQNAYVIQSNELNAYLVSAFDTVVIEKSVFETIIKEN